MQSSSVQIDISHLENLIFLAAISGAGKSRAIDVIADLGFFNIENLPVSLLPEFLSFTKAERSSFRNLVILPDISSKQKLSELLTLLDKLNERSSKVKLIFLDCADDTIIRRYSETRRPHPSFDQLTDTSLQDTIRKERSRLLPFREKAHLLLDTTSWSIHDLRRELTQFIETLTLGAIAKLRINFLSFGFKRGLPPEADLLIDVRFLPNPYFIESLREKDGSDPMVARFVLDCADTGVFLTKYEDLLRLLIPKYISSGKAYLNVAIGCTGGKHRSVAIAEDLTRRFSSSDWFVSAKHRDKDL